jgi:hypothetical protein
MVMYETAIPTEEQVPFDTAHLCVNKNVIKGENERHNLKT